MHTSKQKKIWKKMHSHSIDKSYSSLHRSSGESLSKDETIISKEWVPAHGASCRI